MYQTAECHYQSLPFKASILEPSANVTNIIISHITESQFTITTNFHV